MGSVAVEIKIMPEDMAKFAEIKKAVVEQLKPAKMSEQPVAFGIVAIMATCVIPDAEGGSDKLEQMAGAIPGVSQAEIVSVDRL
jgi:elongation factor 1-beta